MHHTGKWKLTGRNYTAIIKSYCMVSFNIIQNHMSSKLNIKKVSSFHSGNYTCSVQNHVGIDAHTVKVTVKGIHDDAIINDN